MKTNQGNDSEYAKALTPTELRHILFDWNQAQTEYPRNSSIPALFLQQVLRFPNKIAITHGSRNISYRQLNQFADQVAGYLLNNGVGHEQLIAVAMHRSIEFIIVILGILKAGAAYLPIDINYPTARMAYMLKDSAVSLLLVSSSRDKKRFIAEENLNFCKQIISINEIIQESNTAEVIIDNIYGEIQSTDLAHVIYTSGTTGEPKGIEILQRGVVRLAYNANYIKIDSTDRVAHLSNISFDAATFEIWVSLLNGAEIVIVNQDTLLSPIDFETTFKHYQISIALLTTAYFHRIAVRNSQAFSTLKYLLVGGEVVSAKIVKRLFTANTVPEHLIHIYGPAESTVFAVYHEIVRQDCEEKTIPIGQVVSNTCAFVFMENKQLAPIGVVGELYLGGDGLARSYLNKPQLTAQYFMKNPLEISPINRLYKTGDLVRWLPNGKLEFIGRSDRQVKLHGFRIEPREIEHALRSHQIVMQACVVLREEQDRQQLIAYVVLYPKQRLEIPSLHEYLKNCLPQYMLPVAYIEISAIPITENGKIAYALLPVPTLENYILVSKRQIAITEMQKQLTKIWANVLRIPSDKISIYDKFFDLGGSSLLVMQVLADIYSTFSVSVKFSDFLLHSSIVDLERLISKKQQDKEKQADLAIHPVARHQHNLASLLQKRLWLVQYYDSKDVSYNVNKLFHINGKLNIPILRLAINQLIKKHEILRTNFYMKENVLYQKVNLWQENQSYLKYIDLSSKPLIYSQNYIEEEIHRAFNLQYDNLFRATLFRCAHDQYKLLFSLHHIIIDGYSFKIMFNDLSKFYQIFLSSYDLDYMPLGIQFIDYAAWQHGNLSDGKRESMLQYWQLKLQNLPVLDIQLGNRRPAIQSRRGSYYYFSIPDTLVVRATDIAQRVGVSLYTVLFSVYSLLLAKYSRQQDLVVGIPVMNRPQQCLNHLIGFFINTLPLRIDLSINPMFSEFLQKNQTLINEAVDHQDVPFDEILNHLNLSVDPSRHPIFQALFSFNQFQHNELQLTNLQVHAQNVHSKTAKVDIELVFDQQGSELIGHFTCAVDLFTQSSIQRMSQHYINLLSEVCDLPRQAVNQFALLTLRERQQILYDWNNTLTSDNNDHCETALQQLFAAQVLATPDQIALTFNGQQLSYHELNTRTNQLGHYLRNKGVKRGDFIAICLDRSIEMIIAILGVLKSGAAYVPIDPELPNHRIKFMLTDSSARYILVDENTVARLNKLTDRIIDLHELNSILQQQPVTDVSFTAKASEVAYMIYTSGTTGQPKGVICLQKGVCNRLRWMKNHFPLSATDAVLQKTTFCFDVSVWEIFWPLISGARLVLAKPGGQKDNHYLFELIRNETITQCHFVPSMLGLFLNNYDIGQCTSIKRVFCSGEALSTTVRDKFFQQSAAQLYNLYGPTEASIEATYYDCREHPERQSIAIGKPLENIKVYVLDDDLNPVPIGIPGELYIGGVAVAQGYHQREDLTKERFLQNPFVIDANERLYKTGDLVRWLEDGNLQYIDRLDNQVKIRGYRVEMQEIEVAMLSHPKISECVVICRENATHELCLIAYLVLSEAHNLLIASDMRAYLAKELPDYMIPAFFVTINEIPKNVNGKIDRKNLPQFNDDQLNFSYNYTLPKSPLEKAIAKIWQEVLDYQAIDVHDSFFHVGGNSLNALRVLARIHKQFNIELPLRSFFDAPTIAQLAAFLETQQEVNKVSVVSPMIAIHPYGNKSPLFLFHPSGGTVFWGIPLTHHLNNDRPIYAFQDPSVESGILKYPSVEALVAVYIAEMKRVQQQGPYFLVGYSIGATLAVEACKQLAQQGENIAFLGLIDGWGLYPHEYGSVPQEMQIYKTTMQRLAVTDPKKISQLTYLEQARHQLHARYRFPVIHQHLHLFKANELSPMFINMNDNYNHWRRFAAAGITVYPIDGNHETMLVVPNIRQLASIMQNQIDAVENAAKCKTAYT